MDKEEHAAAVIAQSPAALRAVPRRAERIGGAPWVPAPPAPPVQEETRPAVRPEERLLPMGTVAIKQGEVPAGVWIVRSGILELVRGSGRHRVVAGMLQPGDVAGDVPLLLNRPAVCTARTLTRVRADFMPADDFLSLLGEGSALLRAWAIGLAGRHHRVQEALAQSLGGSAESRIVRLLLREARGGTVTGSQSMLAAMLGLRRPTLNRVLKQLEREGLLRVGYRRIDLLAEERLRDRVRDHG